MRRAVSEDVLRDKELPMPTYARPLPMSMMERVFLRNMSAHSHEAMLVLHIILRAICDVSTTVTVAEDGMSLSAVRDSALRFLRDDKGRLSYFCDLIGLEVAFVQEVAIKGCHVHPGQLWRDA